MKPRKWAAEIKAWADGNELEWRQGEKDIWHPEAGSPVFCSELYEFRVKPPEPDWMPGEGDLILAWDEDEAVARPDIFRKRCGIGHYPWICGLACYVNAKPHPLQQERDKYRATLEGLFRKTRDILDHEQAVESIITMQEEAKEALK